MWLWYYECWQTIWSMKLINMFKGQIEATAFFWHFSVAELHFYLIFNVYYYCAFHLHLMLNKKPLPVWCCSLSSNNTFSFCMQLTFYKVNFLRAKIIMHHYVQVSSFLWSQWVCLNLPVSSKSWNRLGQMSITACHCIKLVCFSIIPPNHSLIRWFLFYGFQRWENKAERQGLFVVWASSERHVPSESLTIPWTVLGSQQCQPQCECPALWKKCIMKSGRAAGCSALLKMRSLNEVSVLIGT